MRTLDPSGDPRKALDRGFGVDRPAWATVENVARRIELEPSSSHLLVGGIGSGKTTELWRIHQRLGQLADETGDVTRYIDVAAETRLDELRPGALIALAGKRLGEFEAHVRRARGQAKATPRVATAIESIRKLAHGYSWYEPCWDVDEEPEPDADEPVFVHRVEGVVSPPKDPLPESASTMVPHLRALKNAVTAPQGHCVILFDSLDRVVGPAHFEGIIRDDIRALALAEIGVVLVGPMRLQYTASASFRDLFQNTHAIVEIEPVEGGLDFLIEVLSRRVSAEVMPRETCEEIAIRSGGVLRDLIALAKNAAQEAYVAGSQTVGAEHVARAAEQFGRTRALGLDGEQVKVLEKIRDSGTLIIRGERELVLLETRRVIDYGSGRFVVHPTLVPLLELITVAA